MQKLRNHLLTLLVLALFLFVACADEDEDNPPSGTGGVPSGMARLYGSVRSPAGQSLPDVAMHVIYQFDAAASNVMFPSSVFFFDTTQVLTTSCGGSAGLPDGVEVKIYWDQNNNGVADPFDPQPLVCVGEPCNIGTVNYNTFPLNGEAEFGVAGTFAVTTDFYTFGDAFSPNRFYMRIFCTDGNVLWTSELVDVAPGPSEVQLTNWTCSQCTGVPEVPRWLLDQSYPNPTTGIVRIRYGMEQAAQALLTVRELSRGRVDTLLHGAQPPGSDTLTANLGSRANGLYEYRFASAAFGQTRYLLKNETGISALQGTQEIGLTQTDGSYRFDTGAGVTIDRRGNAGENLGTLSLNRVRLVAMKSGFHVADTVLSVASAESLRVDLTLFPQ